MSRSGIALAILCLAAMLGFAAELWAVATVPSLSREPEAAPPTDANGADPALPPTTPVVMPLRSIFSESDQRPLFSASRRPSPPPPPAELPAPALPSPPRVTLVGTIIGAETKIAMLRLAGTPAVQRVSEGQAIGGWTVVGVQRNKVILRLGATDIEVNALPPSQAGTPLGKSGGIPPPSQFRSLPHGVR